ncbi:MAG: Protein of unknown function (DUF1553)/Protein of unknown function (DUF1549)/Planctomycete [Chthonomonadaceae bacterium]|nr:Protein of unknown function (DUF1553)/Protein of unknown function (DUF1549)/Planctomycete [Chthonomonadaceae bacterium]
MMRRLPISLLLPALLALIPTMATAQAAKPKTGPPVDYNRDVRPILAENCFSCHGQDASKRQAGLRLDKAEGATAKLASGHVAIVPGQVKTSALMARLGVKSPLLMPPASTGKTLKPQQIAILRRWIAQGAKYAPHWAYIPPRRPSAPELPTVAGTKGKTWNPAAWSRTFIDRFIAARLVQEGLRPSKTADRATLLRRLSLDLTGLPPTIAEVDAFVNDKSPDAYEKQVDRLLISPHYGERMAQQWLDLVRYADTDGYHGDRNRNVFPFRDWTITAFNRNMPFDQFTTQQLAGDLLPDPTTKNLIASGYNRLNMVTREGGAQPKEYLAKYMAERIRTTALVWQGSTLGCAECHDHKYDPFTAKDFYRFGAFFADIKQVGLYPNDKEDLEPFLSLPTPDQATKLMQFDAEMVREKKELDAAAPAAQEPLRKALTATQAQRAAFDNQVEHMMVTVAVAPSVTHLLPRGNWQDETGEIVEPGVPGFLQSAPLSSNRATRLDLARWIVSRDNPLTARVTVNRLWMLLFGAGIVRTPGDFGTQGAPPTHPELLDWLATEFMENGWDIKHVMKAIVMSNAYRQSSDAPKALRERDPYNMLLARQSRFRLDAETVRDNALAVSGLLVDKIGGRSVFPYQPDGYWDHCNTFAGPLIYKQDHGEDLYRRGLYTYWKRTFLNPSLLAFDAPSREECVADRPRSNTPLQALVLMNDPTYVEAARSLAEHLMQEGGGTLPERLNYAFQRTIARRATPAEIAVLSSLYQKHFQEYTSDPTSAQKLLTAGEHPVPKDLNSTELAAWTSVARVILNLNETITRE